MILSSRPSGPPDLADYAAARLAFAVIAAITLARLWFLSRSGLELYGDEAQYFAWSRDLAFGYFTKPPLIAWLIAATTALYGTSEAAVRLAAPLCHALTAIFLFATGWRLFDLRTGALASMLWALLPGVSFSSLIISTDAPMLMFAALALFGYAGLYGNPASRRDVILLGLGLGFGLLSKLAMAYALVGLVIHISIDARARTLLGRVNFWAGIALGALIYAPNVVWNLEHQAATYGHLAENAGLGGHLFNPENMLVFLGGQVGVFGPVPLAILLYMAFQRRVWADPRLRLCLCFALPVLGLMTMQALASRAFANWAAFAYVGASLCVARFMVTRPVLANGNLAFHGLILIGLFAWGLGLIQPPIKNDPVAGLHGWRRLAGEIAREWERSERPTLIATDRMEMARLLYYLPLIYGPVRIMSSDGRAHSEFDLSAPLDAVTGQSGLLVSRFDNLGPLAERFGAVELFSTINMPRKNAPALKYYLFKVSNYHAPDFSIARQADSP